MACPAAARGDDCGRKPGGKLEDALVFSAEVPGAVLFDEGEQELIELSQLVLATGWTLAEVEACSLEMAGAIMAVDRAGKRIRAGKRA